MMTPLSHSLRASSTLSLRRLTCLLSITLSLASPLLAAKPTWPTTPAEEISATASPIDAEAPAEVMLEKIEIDDRRYPESRKKTTYVRYKIYQPQNAEELTRMTVRGSTEIFGRLTLPNGKVIEYGKDAIKERDFAKAGNGDMRSKEKLLALPGVEPGSLVEFITMIDGVWAGSGTSTLEDYPIQRNRFPVRRYEWKCRYPSPEFYDFRAFTISAPNTQTTDDEKGKSVSIISENLPALRLEPHLGPRTDFCATILTSCNTREVKLTSGRHGLKLDIQIDKNAGAWAPLATILYGVDQMRTKQTDKVKALATQICEGAKDDMDKARRIHNKVQELYHAFVRLPRRDTPNAIGVAMGNAAIFAESLDDVLEFENKRGPIIEDIDFFWLSLGLYRAAGLQAKAVLLPDRMIARFDPRKISHRFLVDIAAVLTINGAQVFSYPLMEQRFTIGDARYRYVVQSGPARRLPLGILPWEHEGQIALVANLNKEEFISVPFTPAPQSMVANGGVFKLDAEGNLNGKAEGRLTGHTAIDLRARLRKTPPEKQSHAIEKYIQQKLPATTIKVTKISGIETPDDPLIISYEIKWPGFATRTGDRLIFQPEIFQRSSKPAFPNATRVHPVHFHTPWQEVDRIAIQLPPGFEPESPTAPTSFPGDVLLCNNSYRFDVAKHALFIDREFSSKLIDVPPTKYQLLKEWYDQVYAADQHELVFIEKTKTPASAPSAP